MNNLTSSGALDRSHSLPLECYPHFILTLFHPHQWLKSLQLLFWRLCTCEFLVPEYLCHDVVNIYFKFDSSYLLAVESVLGSYVHIHICIYIQVQILYHWTYASKCFEIIFWETKWGKVAVTFLTERHDWYSHGISYGQPLCLTGALKNLFISILPVLLSDGRISDPPVKLDVENHCHKRSPCFLSDTAFQRVILFCISSTALYSYHHCFFFVIYLQIFAHFFCTCKYFYMEDIIGEPVYPFFDKKLSSQLAVCWEICKIAIFQTYQSTKPKDIILWKHPQMLPLCNSFLLTILSKSQCIHSGILIPFKEWLNAFYFPCLLISLHVM